MVMWMVGGRIGLEVPAAVFIGGGEFWCKSVGARGAAPADGLLGVGLFYCGSFSKCSFIGAPSVPQEGGDGWNR